MDDETNQNIISIISDVILLQIKRIGDLLDLAALEAELALKTLVILAVLIFILGAVITVSWLSIIALLFIYLLSLHMSMLSAIAVVVAVNLFVLISLCIIMFKLKARLFFPVIRRQVISR